MNLKVLNKRELLGKQFVIYGDLENPLFLAKDVAEGIEHSNPSQMIKDAELEEHETEKHTLSTLSNSYSALFLTEDGLYEVLMQSRKPIAKEFKKKVKEILKDIRSKGMYATDELLDNPDLLIKVATQLKDERAARKLLEAQIEEEKPKVVFADAVSASNTSILIGELSKILQQNGIILSPKNLFKWLRDNGYLIKRKGTDYNTPTQYSMKLGLFEIKETSITHANRPATISKTSKVTGKGQIYFINKFKQDKN